MSILRKQKAKNGKYPIWNNDTGLVENFYQCALDAKRVEKNATKTGFICVQKQAFDGFKGVKDEVGFGKGFLGRLYNGKGLCFKVIRKRINSMLNPVSGH